MEHAAFDFDEVLIGLGVGDGELIDLDAAFEVGFASGVGDKGVKARCPVGGHDDGCLDALVRLLWVRLVFSFYGWFRDSVRKACFTFLVISHDVYPVTTMKKVKERNTRSLSAVAFTTMPFASLALAFPGRLNIIMPYS